MTGTPKDPSGHIHGRLPFESLGTRSGTILGRYELVRRIGTGGMAEVYEAVHRGLKKTVAVKVLLPDTAANPELRARFLREGEAASRIQHPHVVDVTDVAEDEGVAYMVMEYLEGQNLSHLLSGSDGGRLSLTRTLDILLPIAAALDEAHRHGVVHRDLKPENVFIARASNGRAIPKILDFGVSKLSGHGIPSTTAVSAVLGTPHYMSPEQARGDAQIDGRADQYSFALMIYECITGTLPFRSDNVVALIHEVARGVGTPPSAFVPDLPPELDFILLKALRADPQERYASVAAFADVLLPFASDRARDTFASLLDKEAPAQPNSLFPPPAEITGTFSPSRRKSGEHRPTPAMERHPTPTIAERPSGRTPSGARPPEIAVPVVQSASEGDAPRARPALWVGGVAVVLLLLGLGGYAFQRSNDAPREAPTPSAPVSEPVEPVAIEPADPTAPAATPEPPPEANAVARFHVTVVTDPEQASIELDGAEVGSGTFEQWLLQDGTTHRLVVRAEGYLERSVEFRDAPPPLRVSLDAAPAAPRPRRPAGGDDARPPPPEEEDIRSTR